MTKDNDKLVRDQPVGIPAEQGPLAPYHGAQPPAPQWFTDAIATPYETHFVDCEGAKIHYQTWGDRAKPGLLLVHGNGAHAHWWDFIAPYLTDDYHVVAMTFSGMGDSSWRESYVMDTFAKEQLAVCEAAGLFAHAEKPIIIAHSFGGFVSLLVAEGGPPMPHATPIEPTLSVHLSFPTPHAPARGGFSVGLMSDQITGIWCREDSCAYASPVFGTTVRADFRAGTPALVSWLFHGGVNGYGFVGLVADVGVTWEGHEAGQLAAEVNSGRLRGLLRNAGHRACRCQFGNG